MRAATVLGCGRVDDVGITGTGGHRALWSQLGVAAPGTARTMREVFGKADATFRRIDLLARALVLCCEAAELDTVLTAEQRQEAAILVETDVGALTTDVRFAATLGDEVVAAGAFPYSLTSTSLGEVALRYGLRGPTLSLSVAEHDHRDEGVGTGAGESLREALRLFASGEIRHAIVGVVDTLPEPLCGRPRCMRAIVAVLAADDDGGIARMTWPDGPADPFAPLAALCR